MSNKIIGGSSLVSHKSGSYAWKILNYNQWKKLEPIRSPNFKFPDITNCSWQLELYPSTNKPYIGIMIKLLPHTELNFERVWVSFTLLPTSICHSAFCHFVYYKNGYARSSNVLEYRFDQFLSDKDISNLTTLTIVYKMAKQNECLLQYSETDEIQNVIDQRAKLVLDFNNLLKSEQFSDTVLISSCGKKFQVHKNILAARSAVFSAMFENDMKEKQENLVEIKDVDAETLEELILFIYTGNVNNLKSAAISLVAAADKYAIEDLKIMCEKVLNENVVIDNAVEILVLADLHHAGLLKQKVLRFIAKHLKSVMETPAFKALTNGTHSHLIIEILEDISKNN